MEIIFRNSTDVGRNIAHFRAMCNKKAQDVADALGMKVATYSKYERGETHLTLEFVSEVAKVLRVNSLRLLTSDPDNFYESISVKQIHLE